MVIFFAEPYMKWPTSKGVRPFNTYNFSTTYSSGFGINFVRNHPNGDLCAIPLPDWLVIAGILGLHHVPWYLVFIPSGFAHASTVVFSLAHLSLSVCSFMRRRPIWSERLVYFLLGSLIIYPANSIQSDRRPQHIWYYCDRALGEIPESERNCN